MSENKQLNKEGSTATPYDDVYHTLVNECSSLIIPVVNEVFQKQHGKDEKVTILNNEFYITSPDGKQKEKITDSNFVIGRTCYHFECQSTADGTIILRVFEYGTQIAVRDSVMDENVLTVKFPTAAVLYLRHTKNTPEEMTICIRVPGDFCTYRVPVLKVQQYSLEEIFEKKLFFLLPFHIFVYEKMLPSYEVDETKLRELIGIYESIARRLNTCAEEGIISEYEKGTIIAMSKKVLEALTEKYTKVQKGVKKIMGGQILDYEAKRIHDAARKNSQLETAYNFFKNGVSYEIVRASIECLSDEELQEIYKSVLNE